MVGPKIFNINRSPFIGWNYEDKSFGYNPIYIYQYEQHRTSRVVGMIVDPSKTVENSPKAE